MKVPPLVMLVGLIVRTGTAQSAPAVVLYLDNPEQRYCIGDEDIGWVQISSRFRYQNTSSDAFLLLRHAHQVDYVGLWRTMQDRSAKPDYNTSFTSVTGVLNQEPQLSENDFVRLNPNGDYSQKASFSFPYKKAGRHIPGNIPGDGTYWAAVHVSLWDSTEEYAAKLQKLFHSPPIWTQPLWSQRIRVEVHSDAKARGCP